MKRTMKQPLQCMSFTLMFPTLGKAFNYCKIIGSHARWWNDLVLSGDFIQFHRMGNNASGVSPWWNYFLLSPLRFMQKVQFYWHSALINMYDILVKPPLWLYDILVKPQLTPALTNYKHTEKQHGSQIGFGDIRIRNSECRLQPSWPAFSSLGMPKTNPARAYYRYWARVHVWASGSEWPGPTLRLFISSACCRIVNRRIFRWNVQSPFLRTGNAPIAAARGSCWPSWATIWRGLVQQGCHQMSTGIP